MPEVGVIPDACSKSLIHQRASQTWQQLQPASDTRQGVPAWDHVADGASHLAWRDGTLPGPAISHFSCADSLHFIFALPDRDNVPLQRCFAAHLSR